MEEVQSPPARAWWIEALRAGFVLRPRALPSRPGPLLLIGVMAALSLVSVAGTRAMVAGPADFNYQVWLGSWWLTGVIVLTAWALHASLPHVTDEHERPVARWMVFGLVASVPYSMAALALAITATRLHWVDEWPLPAQWAQYLFFLLWGGALNWRVARTLLPRGRAAVLVALTVGALVLSSWIYPQTPWYSTAVHDDDGEDPVRFKLTQQVFQDQQALLAKQLDAIAPGVRGQPDVFGIVFAPYAGQDVFLRESTMVKQVLEQRFDAKGRVVQLVNHAKTTATHAWATPENLRRTIAAMAGRMDPREDVLVIYMTSHGARDFKLSAAHYPLEVAEATPAMLRKMLDEVGVRYAVVMVSACFSGGWIEPLASDGTLVMTAADAEHTSYGCGRKSDLTFFGRALFDEQLRSHTHSFETAFKDAAPVIRKREEEAKKSDGFSNPQIKVGAAIERVLASLEKRLDAADHK